MSASKSHSRFRRALKAVFSGVVTLGVVAGAGFAVVSGAGVLADRAAAVEPPSQAAPLPVEVAPIEIVDGYEVVRGFVGQIEARQNAALSFEFGGRLTEILADEGDEISLGDPIARIDTALLKAELDRLVASSAALTAQLGFAESQLARNLTLRDEGFASQQRLDEALARRDELKNRIAEVDAARAAVEIQLEKSEILAPFDGRIGARAADPGETVSAGQHILTLLETSAPEFRVGLPLGLDQADLGEAEIEVLGQRFPAELVQLRPDIDPVTRTRTALFKADAAASEAFGQTARLVVKTTVAEPGVWVPIEALREGVGSGWTVLVMDGDVVRHAAVEILHSEADRIFVRGSFEAGMDLILSGSHRIVPGQTVQSLAAGG